MSRRFNRRNDGGELKLNVPPRRDELNNMMRRQQQQQQQEEEEEEDAVNISPENSPARSCVSSEESLKYSSSPETTSMVLVGCPRCLMYVMLSESDPKCPRCKSTVLLEFDHDDSGGSSRRARN